MLGVLQHANYRNLLVAQIIALLGTGLATVALGLLAYDIAGENAGMVLGIALSIKMVAYVFISPVAGVFSEKFSRRLTLIVLDILRVLITLSLLFVDQAWQIYVLIFLLQSCSALFTPIFQATIPDILKDEGEYTKALSLSRLAYDMESLISPMLAAAVLTIIGFHWLFAGTAIGFVISALLIFITTIPGRSIRDDKSSFTDQLTKGIRYYLATPRLRGLLALSLSVAAAGAMVIVNTVVIVRSVFDRGEADVAVALASFGAGSMIVALALPNVLEKIPDRLVMLCGGGVLVAGLAVIGAFGDLYWSVFLLIWVFLGVGSSMVLTPSGRLLRRSSDQKNRPSIFAAQFALSHACWLLTYPLAGWLGINLGISGAAFVLCGIAICGVAWAAYCWPSYDPEIITHVHDDLPEDHPHIQGAHLTEHGLQHTHAYYLDEYHQHWPK